MATNSTAILRVTGVSKRYGGVQALNRVQFDLNYGEVHALVGENGAGKSTLIKVLGGIVPRSEGAIHFDGRPVAFNSPAEAQQAGIAIIHQELSLMPSLTVIENMMMGRLGGRTGLLNWGELERRTQTALARINLHVDPYAVVRELTISQRQMIEIARAVNAQAKLIIMDEPNSSLSETESARLFALIAALKARGIAIIYVSHKIHEVLRIADRITVLRDGHYVGTVASRATNEQAVVNMMVGRELDRTAFVAPDHLGDALLEVHNLSGRGFRNVSFTVRQGEIVALSGLVGAGRSEVARAIFGADRFTQGEVLLQGAPVRFQSPREAIKAGLAMVQEDRKVLSLFMNLQILNNISLAQLPFMTKGVINERRERTLAEQLVRQLDIRLAAVSDPVSSLSGGNQQKTVLARWLATTPKLLILDEPTHGVDVGAKSEIYALMRALARGGVGILLISSELPEVLVLANRIVVMHEGRVTGIIPHEDASEEKLMTYATGLADDFAQASQSGGEPTARR